MVRAFFAFSVYRFAHTRIAAYKNNGCIPHFVHNFGKFYVIFSVGCNVILSGVPFWISCIACRLFAPGILQSCLQLNAIAVLHSFTRIEKNWIYP
jgi:hypothetical protein